ncbi:hypothetical protein D3C73_1333660 [compost metagenome]
MMVTSKNAEIIFLAVFKFAYHFMTTPPDAIFVPSNVGHAYEEAYSPHVFQTTEIFFDIIR